MISESFKAFTSKFLLDITPQINIPCKVEVTSDVIKLKVYSESFEDNDIRILHAIVNDKMQKNIVELKSFDFDKIVYFSFNGSKGKVTVMWVKILDCDC